MLLVSQTLWFRTTTVDKPINFTVTSQMTDLQREPALVTTFKTQILRIYLQNNGNV